MEPLFFALGVAGLVLSLNALRPIPGYAVTVPVFFTGWLTSELAPQLLLIHLITVGAFVASGAADGALGLAGLVCSAITAVLLSLSILRARATASVVEAAIGEALGSQAARRTATRWHHLAVPFFMRTRRVMRVRNIAYGPAGRRNTLDVYAPRDGGTGMPVLLFVHGGGWTIGNKDQQGKPIMLHLASRGWVCVAVNYRLSPRVAFPEHLIDVKRALAWVRSHVSEHGGDPSFVAVTGGSAGGHLTALIGLTQNDPAYQPGFEDADTSVQACVPFYGVYDFTNMDGTRAGRGFVRFLERVVIQRPFGPEFELASPVHRVHADAPPFFVIHGGNDSLAPVAAAREFVRRLREVSREPVAYAELPGAQHAFDVFRSVRTGHAVAGVESFVEEVHRRRRDALARRPAPPTR